ncbi:cob(I)yrinic acid a,c-diamide adenosyltransferase [Lunatimonas salinarum]|uniref:cob(I)yrinic acid a,c-diamide adenosyltransferase n=1 Tax=Lunatimonas salinarum TaxID=1774590 RepID=UPI001AE0812D|nr:cob(I)yrinic acid a,c-diamide adenosyltransferase [Lunatimonas salinarum]
MKIYTKTGDSGDTSLLGGKRVSKSHLRIDAYGTVDELNAFLGLLKDQPVNQNRADFLKAIQDRLFTIGATLATQEDSKQVKKPDLEASDVLSLELEIDQMESSLEPLKNFILPGGHTSVSFAHLARTVCRRAERRVIELHTETPVDNLILQYLNRLSDYLFVLGRMMAKELKIQETIWAPRN